MPFTIIDLIALAVFALGVLRGWRAGGIVMLGNIVSLIVGLVVSTYIFYWLSGTDLLMNWHIGHPYLAIAAFIIILLTITKLLRLVVVLINQLWRIVAIIPLLGPLNSLIGAAIGLAEGAVVLVILSYIFRNFILVSVNNTAVANIIVASRSFLYCDWLIQHIQFLIPSLTLWVS